MDDIYSLLTLSDCYEFIDEWDGEVTKLFYDEYVKEAFINVDASQLRAQYWSSSIAPWDHVPIEAELEEVFLL